MSTLGFGLNVKKKPGPPGPPKRNPLSGGAPKGGGGGGGARKPPPAGFGASDDEDDDDDDSTTSNVFTKGRNPKPATSGKLTPGKPSTTTSRKVVNAQLATFNALSQKASETSTALADDPTIYDYDLIYDTLKSTSNPTNTTTASSSDDQIDPTTGLRRPKYMASLLASADLRKRDLLRAKEKQLQRERDLEGDEFADKEKFVTEAYKAQQLELLKLEEEEKLREEKERKESKGMVGFYSNMLERSEKRYEELAKAQEDLKGKIKRGEVDVGMLKQETHKLGDGEAPADDPEKLAAELNRKKKLQGGGDAGPVIETNDEGQVVDKRQLLSAGLNVPTLPKRSSTTASSSSSARPPDPRTMSAAGGRNRQVVESRARQTRMLEQQLESVQKRALEEEEEAARRVAERQVKTRKTEEEVGGARERYLARKRAMEEEKKRAAGGGG